MGTTLIAVSEQTETIPIVHIQATTAFPVSVFTWMELTITAMESMDIMTKTQCTVEQLLITTKEMSWKMVCSLY